MTPIDVAMLQWCRNMPFDYGKNILERKISRPARVCVDAYRGRYGVMYDLDLQHTIMWKVFVHGVYESNTIRHLAGMIKGLGPHPVLIDVGANIGAWSLVMGKLAPGSTVHAFEPNPPALEYLRRNINLNKLDNIQVHPIGLSDKPNRLVLYNASMGQASIHKAAGGDQYTEIDVRSLDAVLGDAGVDKIDMIKIDVEGHEPAVLDGAQETLARSGKLIVIMEIDANAELTGTRDMLFQRMIDMAFVAYLPKGFPFPLKRVKMLPPRYSDNIIFARGHNLV